MQQDPMGYVDGASLYQYERGNSIVFQDSGGLASFAIGVTPPPNPYAAEMAQYQASYNTWSTWGHWIWITTELDLASANAFGGLFAGMPNAALGLHHFLGNSGSAYDIGLDNFINDDPNAKKHFYSDLDDAMSFVEKQSDSGHGTDAFTQTDNTKFSATNSDWFNTLGQTSWYTEGWRINIYGDRCAFQMRFEVHLRDYYKWVLGSNKKGGFGLKDSDLAKLHLYGVAQDYAQYGDFWTRVYWIRGQRSQSGAKFYKP
jgi:hypothetical protein